MNDNIYLTDEILYKILERTNLLKHFTYIRKHYNGDLSNISLSHKIGEYFNNRYVNSGQLLNQLSIYDSENIDLNNYYSDTNSFKEYLNVYKQNMVENFIEDFLNILNNDSNSLVNINNLINNYKENKELNDSIYIRLGLNNIDYGDNINKNICKNSIYRLFILNYIYNYFIELPQETQNKIMEKMISSDLPMNNDNIIFSHYLYNRILNLIEENFNDDIELNIITEKNNETING